MPTRGCQSNRRTALTQQTDGTNLHLTRSLQQLLQGDVESACRGCAQRRTERLALERGEWRCVARRRLQHLTLVHAMHRAHHSTATERVYGGKADGALDVVENADTIRIEARNGLLHVHQVKHCQGNATMRRCEVSRALGAQAHCS